MLEEAKRLQNEMRVNNIHWYEGNLENISLNLMKSSIS